MKTITAKQRPSPTPYRNDTGMLIDYTLHHVVEPFDELNYYKRAPLWGRVPHSHEQLQFLVVTSGTLHLITDGEHQVLTKGDASLIPPDAVHELYTLTGYEQVGANIDMGSDRDMMGIVGLLRELVKTPVIVRKVALAERGDELMQLLANSSSFANARTALMIAQALIDILDTLAFGDKERFDEKFSAYLEAHLLDRLTVQQIAEYFHMSVSQLERMCRKFFDMGVIAVYNQKRYSKARALLKNTQLRVGEVAQRVGFLDAASFSTFFSKRAGESPSAYRERVFRKIYQKEEGEEKL